MSAPEAVPLPRARRRRGRIALWSGLAVLVVFAVFLAFLATVGTTKSNSPLLGKVAPPVSGKQLANGKPITLTDFAGKWVLVNFAASWCIPCQQEMPQLRRFSEAAPRYNATVLTVTYDSGDTAGLRAMLAGDKATWPAVADAASQVNWGIGGIPESFLVAPDGLVTAYFVSGVQASEVESIITTASSGSLPSSAS
jgi:cytochrome c biogenesis protein CcmG/thiol:disulfide interchange protein DsbE